MIMTFSNAERQARWRARREAELTALREARDGDKGEPGPHESKDAKHAALEAEITALKAQLAEQSLRNDAAEDEVEALKAENAALRRGSTKLKTSASAAFPLADSYKPSRKYPQMARANHHAVFPADCREELIKRLTPIIKELHQQGSRAPGVTLLPAVIESLGSQLEKCLDDWRTVTRVATLKAGS
jgi:hypothetical protein